MANLRNDPKAASVPLRVTFFVLNAHHHHCPNVHFQGSSAYYIGNFDIIFLVIIQLRNSVPVIDLFKIISLSVSLAVI